MPVGVYKRTKEHNRKISEAKTKQLFCDMESCNNKHFAKGLCRKHYNQKWFKDNPECKKKSARKYYFNNKKHCSERMQQYYQDNKKQILKQVKQYRQDHEEEVKRWYEDNKEYLVAKHKQYRQTLAGKASQKANGASRRALTADLLKETVQQVYEDNIKQYGTLTCILCGKPIKLKDSSLEHLTPLSRGGSNDYENLGISHINCNKKKHTKTLKEWQEKHMKKSVGLDDE